MWQMIDLISIEGMLGEKSTAGGLHLVFGHEYVSAYEYIFKGHH
jgi:hypothetical protein